MAEQWAVEVDVKNVPEDGRHTDKLLYLVRIKYNTLKKIHCSKVKYNAVKN